MIFDIETSLDGEVCFVEVDRTYSAWEGCALMEACGFNNFYIGCFNGYENCLVFNKEN